MFMFPKKKNIVDGPKFRIMEFELFPPTSRNYPRFDYEEICSKLEVSGSSKTQSEVHEEFRDRDAADEIVRRLEEKYGTNTVQMCSTSAEPKKSKKSKKGHKFAPEDGMDKGFGYVQEDDFIDDTQAYDEWVPTTMDTAKRGHYVNKGPLEFRQLEFLSSSSLSRESESSNISTIPAENPSSSGDEIEIIGDDKNDEKLKTSKK